MEPTQGEYWVEAAKALGVSLPPARPILLVDDEVENLTVMGAVLDEVHEVHIAANGRDALAAFEKVGEFSLVVTDQRMPGMTGLALLTQFATRAPETVRMLVTAYTDVEPVLAAVNQGLVYGFFLKPWDPSELRAAVARAVSQHRARSALGQLVRRLVSQKDELSRTMDTLEQTRDRLLASERLNTLGRFTAGLSHGVRNNLAVMTSLLALVRQRPLNPDVHKAAEKASNVLESLLPVIDEVGALARGDLQRAHRTVVQPGAFLDDLRGAFESAPMSGGRKLSVSVVGNVRPVFIDRKRVRQAMFALLAYAADASTPVRPLSLHFRVGADGGCRFEITNYPRAISGGRDPGLQGLGFGIEIARAIAGAHGGRLELGAQAGAEARTAMWLGPPDAAVGAS